MNNDDILDVNLIDHKDGVLYESVEPFRFMVLYVLSFGIYGAYWMYKTWNFFKHKERLDIMPVARAIFGLFFLVGLMEKIREYSVIKDRPANYNSSLLFIAWLILSISSRLPDPYWIISFLAFAPLIPLALMPSHSR